MPILNCYLFTIRKQHCHLVSSVHGAERHTPCKRTLFSSRFAQARRTRIGRVVLSPKTSLDRTAYLQLLTVLRACL